MQPLFSEALWMADGGSSGSRDRNPLYVFLPQKPRQALWSWEVANSRQNGRKNSENGLQVPCSSRRYWCLLVAPKKPLPCPQVPGRNLCFVLSCFFQQETSRKKNLLSLPKTFLYFKMATWNTGLALSHFKHFTRGVVFSGGKKGEGREKEASFIVLSLTHLPTSILTLPTPRKALPLLPYLQGWGSWADIPGRKLQQWKISFKSSRVFLFPRWVRISYILFSAHPEVGSAGALWAVYIWSWPNRHKCAFVCFSLGPRGLSRQI